MTCLFCKYEFCYHCGGNASSGSNHFDPGLGCGAGQYGDTFKYNVICSFMVKILWVLLFLVLAPFILLLAPSIACLIGWGSCLLGGRRGNLLTCCFCCLCFPLPLILGLIFLICWIPFAVIAGRLHSRARS